MFPRHYSDEQLLAHLDGELSGWVKRRIQGHLDSCWSCRARQAELEQQIYAVTSTFEERNFPRPDWVAESKRRFLGWEQRFEQSTFPPDQAQTRPQTFRVRVVAIAATVIVCAGILATRSYFRRPALRSAEVMARTRGAEFELSREPVHQAFRLEIVQVRPSRVRRSSRLEVWSDANRARFASRWQENGTLKYATCRAGGGREYVHKPESITSPSKQFPLAALADSGLDPQQIEAGFLHWLESRRWRLLSFAEDVAFFAGQGGVAMLVEQLQSADRRPVFRLTARRRTTRLTAELMIQVDADRYWPQLQRIRFETPERAVELELIAERMEIFTPGQLSPAVFEPDVRFVPPPHGSSRPLVPRAPVEPAKPLPSLPLSEVELTAREIEVRYALHRLGACLGEPIEVARATSGRFVVRGLSETELRKHELSDALRDLPFVDVEVRTVAEAVAAQQRSQNASAGAEIPEETTKVPSPTLPIEEALVRYYKQLIPATEVPARVAVLANEVTSLSDAILAHAWALRRLGTEFPLGKTRMPRGASRWLLEDMLREHAAALREKAEQAQSALAPVFSALGADSRPTAPSGLEIDPGWPDVSLDLLKTAERTGHLIRGLFIGAGLPDEQRHYASQHLLAEFSRLREIVKTLETLVASGSPDVPNRQALEARPKSSAAREEERNKP